MQVVQLLTGVPPRQVRSQVGHRDHELDAEPAKQPGVHSHGSPKYCSTNNVFNILKRIRGKPIYQIPATTTQDLIKRADGTGARLSSRGVRALLARFKGTLSVGIPRKLAAAHQRQTSRQVFSEIALQENPNTFAQAPLNNDPQGMWVIGKEPTESALGSACPPPSTPGETLGRSPL
jgi:hypothetical protein